MSSENYHELSRRIAEHVTRKESELVKEYGTKYIAMTSTGLVLGSDTDIDRLNMHLVNEERDFLIGRINELKIVLEENEH